MYLQPTRWLKKVVKKGFASASKKTRAKVAKKGGQA
jgi:hypothetical protein